jgi:Sec-independent protein translocase protein TatA
MESEKRGKIEQLLMELGRKMDQLIHEAKHATGDLQQDFSEKMEEMNKSREKLEQELKDFTQDEAKWKEVQIRLQNAAHEIRQAVELSLKRKPKH